MAGISVFAGKRAILRKTYIRLLQLSMCESHSDVTLKRSDDTPLPADGVGVRGRFGDRRARSFSPLATPERPDRKPLRSSALLGGHLINSARALLPADRIRLIECLPFLIALGFQAPTADDKIFSQRDLDVFSRWHELVESGGIDTSTSRSLRANAHLADRLLWRSSRPWSRPMQRLQALMTRRCMYVLDHMREYIDVFQRCSRGSAGVSLRRCCKVS